MYTSWLCINECTLFTQTFVEEEFKCRKMKKKSYTTECMAFNNIQYIMSIRAILKHFPYLWATNWVFSSSTLLYLPLTSTWVWIMILKYSAAGWSVPSICVTCELIACLGRQASRDIRKFITAHPMNVKRHGVIYRRYSRVVFLVQMMNVN